MKRQSRFPRVPGGGALTARAYPLPRRRTRRLKALQPRPAVLKQQAERWSVIARDEVRYLFADVAELQAALLLEQRFSPDVYQALTYYLKPTGAGQRRLRRYNGQGSWYLEIKKRKGTMVKKRRRVFYGHIPQGRLSSSYQRQAYEWGQWRLTIDSRLRFRKGDQAVSFPGFVVELKGKAVRLKAAPPPWLAGLLSGHEAPGFGKRKWAELVLSI